MRTDNIAAVIRGSAWAEAEAYEYVSPAYYKPSPIAFEIDGVGDRVAPFAPLLITTTDDIPDDTSTTATLIVDDPHTIGTLDTLGDQDFYAVTLTAGVQYQVGMYAYVGGPSATPLSDAYVEVYDAAGNLVLSGDGGAQTTYNEINSGFDVLVNFTPTASGTYYINARAYDNTPLDGTNGDAVGDYEVFVQTAPADAYQPYYDTTDPLYALDWGSTVNKVNKSARNPDGDEGIRDTGNVQGEVVLGTGFEYDADGDGTNETYATAADLAAAQGKSIEGKNVITIYFAKPGDVFTSLEDPLSPGLPPATITAVGVQQFEVDAVNTALAQFEMVADIIYLEVDNRDDADFVYTSYQGTPGPGVSLLGSMSPPDEPDEGLAQFNSGDERWNATNLAQGGFSFVTLIHEFGHGHGLSHPHDNGGKSGIMNGVEAEGAGVADYTTGDFELNQGVFTMMSYEDGWQSSPYGNAPTDVGYGYLGGLMAFDIAAIQDKYGVNEDYNTGDDIYYLPDANEAGTFFFSIWDAGGTDTIAYTGTADAVIDLRAATLEYEVGGGGNVSYANGIFGGFTIANAVVIENATGGSGDDRLVGNAADNLLDGGDGSDTAVFSGDYALYTITEVSLGVFEVVGPDGTDTLQNMEFAQFADQTVALVSTINVIDGTPGPDILNGTTGADLINGYASDDIIDGKGGGDTMRGGTGNDRYFVRDEGDTIIELLNEGDDFVEAYANFTLPDNVEKMRAHKDVTLVAGNQLDNTIIASPVRGSIEIHGNGGNDNIRASIYADVVYGDDGNDTIFGDNGDDYIEGGAGDDRLTGGAGNDELHGGTGEDYMIGNRGDDEMHGGDDSDVLIGSEGMDMLYGDAGNDLLRGGADNDTLYGGSDRDQLFGDAGDDVLWGGAGQDFFTGGAGADRFMFDEPDLNGTANGTADRIRDFDRTEGDLIDLSAIDAIFGEDDDAFTFIGDAAFSGTAGELRFQQYEGGYTALQMDVDGDGKADYAIVADGTIDFTAADFVL